MADLQLDATRTLRTVADLPCPRGIPVLGNLFQMAPARAPVKRSREST
jgi:hypothetical protein